MRGLEGLGCEWVWLAGLVWEGLDCVGFDYKTVEITAASSNIVCGRVPGLLCMGRYRAGSNLAVHFDFFLFFPCRIIFLSVDRSHLRCNKTFHPHKSNANCVCVCGGGGGGGQSITR